jgi:hypothetical protein
MALYCLCCDSTEYVLLSFRTTEWLQIVTMIYFSWFDLEGQRRTMIQPCETTQALGLSTVRQECLG